MRHALVIWAAILSALLYSLASAAQNPLRPPRPPILMHPPATASVLRPRIPSIRPLPTTTIRPTDPVNSQHRYGG